MWRTAFIGAVAACPIALALSSPTFWGRVKCRHTSSSCRRTGSNRWRPLSLQLWHLWSTGQDENRESGNPQHLGNPRFPVRNPYLAGWALTQNDTACLERLQQEMGYTLPSSSPPPSNIPSDSAMSSQVDSTKQLEISQGTGDEMWGEASRALMHRVDIINDLDQRRLAASRFWQKLQEDVSPTVTSESVPPALSWAEVNALFEHDKDFVLRERQRSMEEAAASIPEPWKGDQVSQAWVASYRLSMFETRRQAQRFFSWAVPDEGALDCILKPGKQVLEVGSGLGYWAHLLKTRSGDETRVRCFDPYAPDVARQTSTSTSMISSAVDAAESDSSANCFRGGTAELELSPEEEAVDVWFGEGRASFTPTERGSFGKIAEDPNGFKDWSLFVCWPSDGQWPAGCLQSFRGDDFFYVGEAEGGATRMPWPALREEWELEKRVEIPRWPGCKDALWWYRRRGAAPLPPVINRYSK